MIKMLKQKDYDPTKKSGKQQKTDGRERIAYKWFDKDDSKIPNEVSFEALMKSIFQMSSMGELTFFLGLQVKKHKGGSSSLKISNSKDFHSNAVKRIFKYHQGQNQIWALCYPRTHPCLEAFSDSTNGGSNLDRNFHNRVLSISWTTTLIPKQCKKQTIVATSTTEAEYVAVQIGCGQLCVGFKSIVWTMVQFHEYQNPHDIVKAHRIVKNPVNHSTDKAHRDSHHFIRELL
ncbi:hypothetical protein Tco_0053847 [Tanacetum coccineum]